MAYAWLAGLILVLITVGTYAWGAFRAAPYVPTKQSDVVRMLSLANIQPSEKVVDLGAGDARFVITAAKQFKAQAEGYEISLFPFVIGKLRLALAGLPPKALMFKDFFHVDLSTVDVVMCFLTPGAMAKLLPKFDRELKPGARVVSYAFSMPGWTLVTKDKPAKNIMSVYVYRR